MVHAGWRGLAAGVVREGVAPFGSSGPQGALAAAIGPGAGPCCYEVGEEVQAVFADHGPARRRGRNLDLKAIARTELARAGVTEVHDVELCTICSEPASVLLSPPGPRRHRAPGGDRVAELIRGLRAERVRANLERVRAEIARVGRDPGRGPDPRRGQVRPLEEFGVLAEAGIELVGENRAQDLVAKAEAYPGSFTWDFIGQLQSRKVRQLAPLRSLHPLGGERLGTRPARATRHADSEVLIEVNVAGEQARAASRRRTPSVHRPLPGEGRRADDDAAASPTTRRRAAPISRRSRELAEQHGLTQLSMGTSQDYLVAVQEGATIVRLGTSLCTERPRRVIITGREICS